MKKIIIILSMITILSSQLISKSIVNYSKGISGQKKTCINMVMSEIDTVMSMATGGATKDVITYVYACCKKNKIFIANGVTEKEARDNCLNKNEQDSETVNQKCDLSTCR